MSIRVMPPPNNILIAKHGKWAVDDPSNWSSDTGKYCWH